ncbi:MAG TPA: nitroreductase family deazaflavin-dependent oxidoreductase [Patescibacteria group bacterium]|nr:nitroreductase family deazaflavin-dependent oxidoreductase [Patescibacteria group bacterium]
MAARPLTARDDDAPIRSPGRPGLDRGTDRTPALDAELASDDRFAQLRMRGRRSGEPRLVTVGFATEPDGTILIAAGAPDSAWARNLLADPTLTVSIGSRTYGAIAELLDDRDPRRGRAVRDLILRYGTPSEGLGSGPIFAVRPAGPRST